MPTPSAGTDADSRPQKVSVPAFRARKHQGEPLVMVTAYDYPSARAAENAGLDAILVGDSLGMVVLGYDTTLPVTMEEMLHHCRAVSRGARTPLLIGDMPFLSYQASVAEAVRNAGRFLQGAGMDAVKLEGGRGRRRIVRAIVDAGIPVMGHLGLTPQSVRQIGYRLQGRTAAEARRLVEDAEILQEAGCFALVLESVPARLARFLSERLEIPTIGIGAGRGCDGQVLVFHDLVGFYDRFTPRFARRYADLHSTVTEALRAFRQDVVCGRFPGPEHCRDMEDAEWEKFLVSLGS